LKPYLRFIIIIIIVVVIGRTALDSVFTTLDFVTVNFHRARSSFWGPAHNLEGEVSVFMTPSGRVGRLYPLALGSLFFAFYDTQGCAGGILTLLHKRLI
jgi:hypothetical protein